MTPRPSQPAAGERIVRLAQAVAGLGDSDWEHELAALGAPPSVTAGAEAPTYEALASAGVDTVVALVDEGRWDAAAGQADRLARAFAAWRTELHPVAGESFEGLRAAVHAHDRDELDDFVGLLREIFRG